MSSWRHLNDTEPRARRDHPCYLCGLPIQKGERYVCRRGVSDRELVTCRMHRECQRLSRDWDEWDWLYHEPAEFREWLELRTERLLERERTK